MSTYKPQAPDTSENVERRQFEIWRRMTSLEKLQAMARLCESVDELARIGIRQRHPEADEREVFLRLAAMKLDRTTMIRAYGWDPEGPYQDRG